MDFEKKHKTRSTMESNNEGKLLGKMKTRGRVIKYMNNKVMRGQMGGGEIGKLERGIVRMQRYIKPSVKQIAMPSKSIDITPRVKQEQERKMIMRTIQDDNQSRVSKLSRASRVSRMTKYQQLIKAQDDRNNMNKNLSKQLARKIRNESIYNWNLKRNDSKKIKSSQSQIKSQMSDIANMDDLKSQFGDISYNKKIKTQGQITRLQQLKEQDQQLLQDDQIWNNPALKVILQQYNIKDKYQLYDFLQNNEEYFAQLYSGDHLTSMKLELKPMPSQYKRKYQKDETDQQMPLITENNYETLQKLALLKEHLKQLTISQSEFYPKRMVFTESAQPPNQINREKKQITYTTSYGFNFPHMLDYQSKIVEKAKQEHVVKGFPLLGQTEYKNTFVEPPDQTYTATELAQFFRQKQSNPNPMKVTKGMNFFASTYRKNFNPKRLLPDERRRVQSQLQCSIQHPKHSIPAMYQTTTNEYSKYESQKKRQRGDPGKFGALSRLKTILLLNKSLKKQITPHVSNHSTIIR